MSQIKQSEYLADPFFLRLQNEVKLINFDSNSRPEVGHTKLSDVRTKESAYKFLRQNNLIYFVDDKHGIRIFILFKEGEIIIHDKKIELVDKKIEELFPSKIIGRFRHRDSAACGDQNKYIMINLSDYENVCKIAKTFK